MSGKLVDLIIILVLLSGIVLFKTLRTARLGNLTAAGALLFAVGITTYRYPASALPLLLIFAALGTVGGGVLARRVSMVQIPAMVALQNGMGGMASFLVSFVELTRTAGTAGWQTAQSAAVLGILVGAATFGGSIIAAGRLSHRLAQRPRVLKDHNRILVGLGLAGLVLAFATTQVVNPVLIWIDSIALVAIAIALGIVFSLRVGGADMPVLISFLNSGSGLAAALCGMAIGNWLLIAAGALVGVSGMILTQIMCRAMNRDLLAILTGRAMTAEPARVWPGPEPLASATEEAVQQPAEKPTAIQTLEQPADPFAQTLENICSAEQIIIVPGYGMALAEAQDEVSQLADKLTAMGKNVVFAIHPVAGRMPGHMHVLLAEAEVDYGMIQDMQVVNPRFADTDLVLIVGACDVVNPAAVQTTGTPISGMPILRAYEAKKIVVCNLDDRPGYSGVDNPLYQDEKTTLLLGDARETVGRLLQELGDRTCTAD